MSGRAAIVLMVVLGAVLTLPGIASARSCAGFRVRLIQNDVIVGAQQAKGLRCQTVRTAITRAAKRWEGIPMSRYEPERLRTGRVVLTCTTTTDPQRAWVTHSICRRGPLRATFTAAAVVAGAKG